MMPNQAIQLLMSPQDLQLLKIKADLLHLVSNHLTVHLSPD